MHEKTILLHLSLIEGIGPAAISHILESRDQNFALTDLYILSMADMQKRFGFSFEKSEKIVNGLQDAHLLDKELEDIERYDISWVTLLDDNYPESLPHIHLPPAILYWQGATINTKQSIAIVGSRVMNSYGRMAIEQFVPSLVGLRWTIVSGGAIGADSYAHQCTLHEHGKTVAVLGSGLLRPYPSRNKKLFKEIVQSGGTIVSPFPIHAIPLPGNFPARNRVIAGLSRGCIVVQAAQKSGARITAQFALEQGADVFAVPGPITDPLSVGCHDLIKQGAKLIHSVEDILEEFGQSMAKKRVLEGKMKQFDEITENIITHCNNPIPLDDLVTITGLSVAQLHQKLFDMQIQGLICQYMGLWQRL